MFQTWRVELEEELKDGCLGGHVYHLFCKLNGECTLTSGAPLPFVWPTGAAWRYRGSWVAAFSRRGDWPRRVTIWASPIISNGWVELSLGWTGAFSVEELWQYFPAPPPMIRDSIFEYNRTKEWHPGGAPPVDSIPNQIHLIEDEGAWNDAVQSYHATKL